MSKKKDSKKKQPAEEDESTQNIMKIYRKKLEAVSFPICKRFREKIDEAIEDQGHLISFIAYEVIKPQGVQAIFEALEDLSYKHLKEIKLYKIEMGDDGLQYLCKYLEKGRCTQYLVIPNNEITAMGCIPLGISLGIDKQVPILKLKLDMNDIGTEGLKNLSKGLCQNPFIERLSLNYCNIDSGGAKYLQEILGYIDTKLWSLKLKGNFLRNDGVYQLFRALEFNTSLNKLVLSNNQFGESEDIPVIDKICQILSINTTCYYYDFQMNGIYDEGASKLLECVKLYKTIWRMELPDVMAKEIKDEFKKTLKKRKKPKKKKKKKGKKGKKKKK